MNDVSLIRSFLAGLVSFLSPCVLPLVPGYISMLSGIGMEQLRKGEVPAPVCSLPLSRSFAGFSVVFISFGASASAVGLPAPEPCPPRPCRRRLDPAIRPSPHRRAHQTQSSRRNHPRCHSRRSRRRLLLRHAPLFAGLGASHFFSLSLIGFFGPSMARWLNRDVTSEAVPPTRHLERLLPRFRVRLRWTPCIGPILATVLALAAASDTSPAACCSSPFTPPAWPFPSCSPRSALANSWFSTRTFESISMRSSFSGALLLFL